LALARKGVELDKDGRWPTWMLLTLGMAEYRSGHYAAADKALVAAAQAGPDNANVKGIAAFYQAMSLFRQGKEDEARKLAIEAAATMKPLPKDEKNPLAGSADHDNLILWLAYKEAKAMIQFDEKKGSGCPDGRRCRQGKVSGASYGYRGGTQSPAWRRRRPARLPTSPSPPSRLLSRPAGPFPAN
jgi:hypothetical protein